MAIGVGIGNPFNNAFSWSSYCTPLNLIVIAIPGGIRVTWTDNPKCIDEDGYEIWVSVDGGAYVLLNTVAAGVGLYDDMTDYAGSTVLYKVRAYKGIVYSDFTDESAISIPAEITNLAAIWINDFARVTFVGTPLWETELYSSLDNVTYTLVTTIIAGTLTYDDYTWQGTTVYFKARAKKGIDYGGYCTAINIVTPLTFKLDQNPRTNYIFDSHFGLAVGKTIHVDYGDGHSSNLTTVNSPIHNYTTCGSPAADPYYIQLSGDLDSITLLYIANPLAYGDISKWRIDKLTSIIDLRLHESDLSGDLSNWIIPATCTILYLSETKVMNFTGVPRGELKQIENAVCGLYMLNASCNTAAIDSFLSYANIYFAINTPNRNSYMNLSGATMGIPTGGNNNINRLAILAAFIAAGFTCGIVVRTI